MATRMGLEPMTSAVTGRHSNQLNYRAVLLLCRCVSATCIIIRTMPHIVNTFLKKSFGRGKSPPIPFVLPKSHSAESSFSSLRSLCTSLNCIDLCRPYFMVRMRPRLSILYTKIRGLYPFQYVFSTFVRLPPSAAAPSAKSACRCRGRFVRRTGSRWRRGFSFSRFRPRPVP